MDTVRLGRTGLDVSVAGLGCGGHSRLGQAYGNTTAESVKVVQRAIDLGITYIDTARAYGTEGIVGEALRGRRDDVVLSTKAFPVMPDESVSAAALRAQVEESLRELGTDHIDVYHLHGVVDDQYAQCRDELLPEMQRLRDAGTVRFVAISERFAADPGHVMLPTALADDCWDVVMVGFNLLNPSARGRVFPLTVKGDVAVEVMFAVRRALSQPDELRRIAAALVAEDRVPADAIDPDDPLGFLVHAAGADSVVDAAYRFARHEPGCTVILTGTGNPDHLAANVASINRPPLPDADRARLADLFGHLDHLSGN